MKTRVENMVKAAAAAAFVAYVVGLVAIALYLEKPE
jgi:hypothetical protein